MFRKLLVFLVIFLCMTSSAFGAFTAVNVGPTTDFVGDINVPSAKGYYINGTLLAFGDITNALGVTMANVGSTAINASLIPDSHDDTDLGSSTYSWRSIYVGTAGKIYLGTTEEVSLEVTDANTLAITASSNVDFSGGLDVTGGIIVGSAIMSDTADTDNLGHTDYEWKEVYISDAGHLYLGSGQDTNLQRTASGVLTITAANGVVTSAGLTVTGAAIPAAASSHALGSAAAEWTDVFLDDTGYVYFGVGQDVHIQRTGSNTMTITASSGVTFSDDLITTASVGRDSDNDLEFGADDHLVITIAGNAVDLEDWATGAGDNNKLTTKGYVDDAIGGVSHIAHFMDIGIADVNFYINQDTTDDGDLIGSILNQSVYARNVTTFGDASGEGQVTITGTTADGTVGATEVIAIGVGATAGAKAFMNITAIVVADTAAGTFDIGIGDIIGLPSAFDHVDDVYQKVVDGVEEFGEISGNTNTTNNTLDCATIAQNEDITVYYHP